MPALTLVRRLSLQAVTLDRMKSTISSSEAPGWNTAATPWRFSSAASSSGIIPPTITFTSVMSFSRSSSITRGTMALCAPERIERPITCTSSCSAAFTIISGVCRNPV